jgi:hypothetical protein
LFLNNLFCFLHLCTFKTTFFLKTIFFNPDMTNSKKQKILNWLAYIGETDSAIIEDTMNRCRADQETLRYFLTRANETQRASVAAKLANIPQHANQHTVSGQANLPDHLVSQTQAADMLNVSERSVATAKKESRLFSF